MCHCRPIEYPIEVPLTIPMVWHPVTYAIVRRKLCHRNAFPMVSGRQTTGMSMADRHFATFTLLNETFVFLGFFDLK